MHDLTEFAQQDIVQFKGQTDSLKTTSHDHDFLSEQVKHLNSEYDECRYVNEKKITSSSYF